MDSIKEKYDYIGEFYQGVAIVVKDDKYGAILVGGHEIISPTYDYISAFKDGYAKAFLKGAFKILNLAGQECKIYNDKLIVIPAKYDSVRDFKNGYACVELNEKWGAIDTEGKEIFEPQFYYLSDFVGGTAKYQLNARDANSWGYVNVDGYCSESNLNEPDIEPDGNLIISRYLPTRLPNGSLVAADSARKVRINNKGELVVKNGDHIVTLDKNYLYADDFVDGLARVTDSTLYSGYVDTRGKIVVPIEYSTIGAFIENKAFGINKNKKICLISTSGSVIKVLDQYDEAHSFWRGYAIVSSSGQNGLINGQGQEILAPLDGNIYYKSTEHEFRITLDGKEGYFNALTRRLVRPRYKKILEVSREYAKAEVPEIGNVFVDWEGRTFIEDNGRIYLPDWCTGAKKILDNVYLGLSDSGKWGLVDQNGETLCIPSFDSIGKINSKIIQTEVHYTVKRGGYLYRNPAEEHVIKYGIYDLENKVSIAPCYDKPLVLNDGYYLVEVDGLFGAIDLNGNQILKPEWLNIKRFRNYYIVSRKVEKDYIQETCQGLTDNFGNLIIDTDFDYIDVLKDGLYKTRKGCVWFIYNDEGRLTEESYEEVSYDGNMINVTSEGWQGYLDEHGKKVILSEEGKYIELPSKFSWGRDFKNGIAEVLINGCENLVDKEFNLVLKKDDITIPIDKSIEYIVERDCAGNCIFVRDKKYGLISSKGEIVIDAKYHRLSILSFGFYVAAIKDDNIYCNALGIIDVDENIILNFEYSTIEPFKGKIPRNYYTWDDKYVTEYVDMPNRIEYWLIHKSQIYKDVYGLVNLAGKVCIEPVYEDIQKFGHGFFLKKDDKYKVVNLEYSRVSEKNYDAITPVGNDLWKVTLIVENGRKLYGILDSHGKERLEPVYTFIGDINENNVAIISCFGSYGLIDEKYNIIAKPIYEHISNFKGGKALARKYNGIEGTIDTKGIFIANINETKNDNVTSKVKTLNNGFIVIKDQANQLCAIIDSEENMILPYHYKHIEELDNEIYRVSIDSPYSGPFGILDKNFNEIIAPVCRRIEPLGGNYIASINDITEVGIFNSDGELILPYMCSSIKPAWGNFVWIYTNKDETIGLATIDGDILIEPCFGKVEPFENGYAKVNVGHWYNEENEYSNTISRKYSERAWGVVDISGRLVVPTKYDSIKIEEDGTFSVFSGFRSGRLNNEGKLIIKDPDGNYIPADSRFDWQYDFDSKGFSCICCFKEQCEHIEEEYGKINLQGQFVISSKSDNLELFHIIPDGFDWAYYCSEETFIGVKNDKKGVYNYDGKEIISAEYYDIQLVDDVYIVKKDCQAGVLSNIGEVILPMAFDSIEVVTDPYSDIRYYKCNDSGKYGLYSIDGSELIPTNYKQIAFLAHNLLSTQGTDGKFMIFNSKGVCVNNEYFDEVFDFGKPQKKNDFSFDTPKDIENPLYAIVQKNGLYGTLNALGATEIYPKYKDLYCVTRNVFCTNGINIDSRGLKVAYSEDKLVCIPDEYTSGELLENGLVLVQEYNKYGCINQMGEIVIPVEYNSLKVCKNLIIASRNKENNYLGYCPELGVINFFNEVIIPFSDRYQEINISKKTILYKENFKWGAFSHEGHLICDAKYAHISALTENLIKVGMNGTEYDTYDDYYWEDGERHEFTNYNEYSVINWGIINCWGKEILPNCYRDIYTTDNDNFIRIQKGNRIGCADITGKILLEPKYASIGEFVDGHAIVSKTSTYYDEYDYERKKSIYGVIDFSFKEVIPCLFGHMKYDRELGLFETNVGYKSTDGRYLTEVDGKTIFVNKKYKYCKPFQDNCAIAVLCTGYETHYGLIDKMSNDIIPPIFEKLELIDKGLYKFRLNKLYGLIDSHGDIVLANQHDNISKYSEGYGAIFKTLGLDNNGTKISALGLIDRKGNEILPVQYSYISKVSEGKVVLMKDNIWLLYDVKTGRMLTLPDVSYVGICKEGVCRYNLGGNFDPNSLKTKGGTWGFIDINGKIIINAKYENVYAFSEGKAAVREHQKWGFINKNGDVIIPCEYDKVESNFKNEEGKLARDGKIFVFDKTGKQIDTHEQEIWQIEDNTPNIYDLPF